MTNLSMRHRLTHASDAAAKATKLCHRIIHAHFGLTKARRPFPLAQRPHQNFRHKKGHIRITHTAPLSIMACMHTTTTCRLPRSKTPRL